MAVIIAVTLPDGDVSSVQPPAGCDAAFDNGTFASVGNLCSRVRRSCIAYFRRGQSAYRLFAIQQSADSCLGIFGREIGLELFFQPGVIVAAYGVIRYAVSEVKIQPAIFERDFLYLKPGTFDPRPYGVEAVDGSDCAVEAFIVDYASKAYVRKAGQKKPKRNSNFFITFAATGPACR